LGLRARRCFHDGEARHPRGPIGGRIQPNGFAAGDLLQSSTVQEGIGTDLNYFLPWIGETGSYEVLLRTLQVLGLRDIAGYGPFPEAEAATFRSIAFPRRPTAAERGIWHVHELPRPNVGNYSPTELVTAHSGAAMLEFMRHPDFDFTRKAVVGSPGRSAQSPRHRGVDQVTEDLRGHVFHPLTASTRSATC
jgi:hypothetical protein